MHVLQRRSYWLLSGDTNSVLVHYLSTDSSNVPYEEDDGHPLPSPSVQHATASYRPASPVSAVTFIMPKPWQQQQQQLQLQQQQAKRRRSASPPPLCAPLIQHHSLELLPALKAMCSIAAAGGELLLLPPPTSDTSRHPSALSPCSTNTNNTAALHAEQPQSSETQQQAALQPVQPLSLLQALPPSLLNSLSNPMLVFEQASDSQITSLTSYVRVAQALAAAQVMSLCLGVAFPCTM